MSQITRRKFIRSVATISTGTVIGGYLLDSSLLSVQKALGAAKAYVYLARNGSPAENVAKVIDMRFGGIENFIGYDDVVVINPNGQWTNQGGSNCACCMGLIDLILNRPGGFDGEIIFAECTQFSTTGYWTASSAQELERNGPYGFNDMILHYHSQGYSNVSGIRIRRSLDEPSEWPVLLSPTDGQGWIRSEWVSPNTGCLFYLPHPVIRSPYSNRLVDLSSGIYEGGVQTPVNLRFIKIPNLNNHGSNAQQDYAGITSATKSFLGIAELEGDRSGNFVDGHKNMHCYENTCHGDTSAQRAFATGESAGAWMKLCRKPDLFLTTAEWVGWGDRISDQATQARTVGLAEDPASLDYFMSKYVLWPCYSPQQYFNPDYDIANNMTRQTINGCISQGFGTASEDELAAYVYDFNAPEVFRFDIDRMIQKFRSGEATQQDVLDLIEQYNQG